MVSMLSSLRPVSMPRLISRWMSSPSGTSSPITASIFIPRRANSFFSSSAWGIVRGNPSRMSPLDDSLFESMTSARMSIIRSSGINCPFEM